VIGNQFDYDDNEIMIKEMVLLNSVKYKTWQSEVDAQFNTATKWKQYLRQSLLTWKGKNQYTTKICGSKLPSGLGGKEATIY
jgi:hypothetical protein